MLILGQGVSYAPPKLEKDMTMNNETLRTVPLNKLKASGETFFKRKPDAKGVFIINHYNKAGKEYSCTNYETGAEIFIKANKPVFIGFDY